MGAFQFSGYSFGVEGSAMAGRPADAPPLNSFLVWRGNKAWSNGGFGLGGDTALTPGVSRHAGDAGGARGRKEQPRMAEVLLEDNWVGSSPQPLSLGYGITGLYGRANSFPVPSQ